MRVRLNCGNTQCGRRFDCVRTPDGSCACPACGHITRVNAPSGHPLQRCPCCDGDELYVRKDFPQKLGVAMVAAAGLGSFVLLGMGRLLEAFGVLIAMVLLDLVLYMLIPKVTVCYRCRAEFRDWPINPEHAGFDLATSEKYR